MTIAIIILSVLALLLWVKTYLTNENVKCIKETYAVNSYVHSVNERVNTHKARLDDLQHYNPKWGMLAYINQTDLLYPIGDRDRKFPLIKGGVYEVGKMIVLDGILIPDGARIMVLGFSDLKVTIFCEQITCNIDTTQFQQLVVTREEMDKRIQEANEALDGAREELQEAKDLMEHNDYLIKQNEELRSHIQELNRQLAKVPSPKPKKKK